RVAATRQNAGRLFGEIGDGMNPPAGMVNAPAATVCAKVMVVSGRLRDARLSQVAARTRVAPEKTRATKRAERFHRFDSIVESIICPPAFFIYTHRQAYMYPPAGLHFSEAFEEL